MSGPRARSAVPADHRSAHPDFPGVPWWGAVLLAITFTAIGFAYDASSGARELGSVFAVCFGFGCVLAVLAVRQSGVFTAVIQPPLLLFFAVPGAYFLFHSSEIHGLKDLAINCGYPLIERFPLMFFTSALVLLLGAARWYVGRSAHGAAAPATEKPRKAGPGLLAALTAKLTAATAKRASSTHEDEDEDEPPRRRRAAADRPRRRSPAAERARANRDPAARSAARKPTKRTGTPSRSRHARPADTEIIEPVVDRPRRPRPARSADDAPPPRRRSRDQREREAPTRKTRARDGQPRERRSRERSSREDLPPLDRRSTYERPTYERPERRRRYRDYDDFDPLSPNGTTGSGSSSHHPVSRVRYRGGDEDGAERTEYPSRSRSRRSWDPDDWEYDV